MNAVPGRVKKGRRGAFMRLGLALVLGIQMAGCGFHLRGTEPTPEVLSKVRLQAAAPGDDEIVRRLRERLALYPDLPPPGPDAPVLIVSGTNLEQRIAAIDTQGVAREFLLILHIQYRLQAADGRDLIPTQTMTLQRDFTFVTNNVLALDNQMQSLREELLRAGAERLLRAVSAYRTAGGKP